MAKKKRKKKKLKVSKQIRLELVGLLLIFLAIFSSGATLISDGLISTGLANIFRFFLGIWYFIASIILFCLGIYFVIKRKLPVIYTRRSVGVFIFFLGILLYTQIIAFEKMLITPHEQSILKASLDHYIAYINDETVGSSLGGGILGTLIFVLTFYLFSFAGSKIVAVFALIIGLVFMTNIPLSVMIQKGKQVFSGLWEKVKEAVVERKEQREQKELQRDNTSEEAAVQTLLPSSDDPEVDVKYAFETDSGQLKLAMTPQEEQVEKETEETADVSAIDTQVQRNTDYQLPPAHLLAEPVTYTQQAEKSQIQKTVKLLEQTFTSFGVKAKITKVHVGPAVTKYEVFPEAGVKVSKILSLQDDLALALAAQDIRIEAPIPGKSAVGIEVPNESVAPVSLSEVLDIGKQTDKKLLFALGKDISGHTVQDELNKMPHLLIAGATGSGKSVCINGIITSILMRAKPEEVKMMMIDPKKVELNVYNGIPHLLSPVVTDPKKAAIALKKVVAEMESRYELFSTSGTRNLESYNNYLRKQEELTGEEISPLPYIVVLVDELADLMMVASSEVEDSIMRLAQMARAAGIHLIIATQRPSVDVITGVIKANIPSRIAFSVSSQIDSRTILDVAGAEKLLGRGDMLYIPVGMSKPIRVQGAFLSDEEVERVVNHCIEQQKASYQEDMIPNEADELVEEVEDELFEEAVQMVVDMQSASVSMLQRRFRIGYNRAARLIDAMEVRGIVGPYEGNKPRIVLLSKDGEVSNE